MKKIFITLLLLLTIFFCSSTIVNASSIDETTLPEYESSMVDYSNIDNNYRVVQNDYFVSELRTDSINLPKISQDSKKTNSSMKGGYQNIYSKDGYENNNSKDNASDFGVLFSEYALGLYCGSTIHDVGPNYATDEDDRDIDFYEFTTQEPYYFQIDLIDIPTGCDYDIKMYVKTKIMIFFDVYTEVASSTNGGSSSELINSYENSETNENFDYLPEGTYVLEVYSYNGCSSQEYCIHIGFNGLDDTYETNDTSNYAYYYNLPSSSIYATSIQGTIDKNDDVDWFEINPPSCNSRITINLHSPASNYKYNMEFYNGTSLMTSNYSSNAIEDEYADLQLIEGNTYYIKIYSSNQAIHSTKFEYTLSFSGTNSNDTYSFKDYNGNWNQYGMIWTYDQIASTNNGYTAKKYYSYSESYLYMIEKIYLYNFNAFDIVRAMGAYEKLIDIINQSPNYLSTINENVWYTVGEAVWEAILKHTITLSPVEIIVQLGYTSFKFICDGNLDQYQINLYNYMATQLREVANNVDNYRIEIEIYSRAGSTDEYIYISFLDDNELYAPAFFSDTIYTNEIVYGNISYIDTQNYDYVNEYLFNENHNFKNNFPF